MRRLSNNRDLFEAPGGEPITATVEAIKVPYQATPSKLESGAAWTQVQTPTLQTPVEIRRFTMPAGSREFFVISYGFPPAGQTDAAAKYTITLSGGGTTDGPNDVLPPISGSTDDLPYEFRLPSAAPESTVDRPTLKAEAKKAVVKGGKKSPNQGGRR